MQLVFLRVMISHKIIWSLNSSRIFSVKSLCERMFGPNHPIFPVKAIGSQKRLHKHVFLSRQHPRARFPQRLCLREDTSV